MTVMMVDGCHGNRIKFVISYRGQTSFVGAECTVKVELPADDRTTTLSGSPAAHSGTYLSGHWKVIGESTLQ